MPKMPNPDALTIQPNGPAYHRALDCLRHDQPLLPLSMEDAYTRLAGVVPVIWSRRRDAVQLLVMRPMAQHAHLPPPLLQLCKGTRMREDLRSGQWRDVEETHLPCQPDRAEPLAVTALREAHEEMGLLPDNISDMWDMGTHGFLSSRGRTKHMRLFALTLRDPHALIAPSLEYASTAEVRWLTFAEAREQIRPEHYRLLPMILGALTPFIH